MLSLVPPVGSRIRLDSSYSPVFERRSDVRLYSSGTAALAAALQSVARAGDNVNEVLLPAYGCPALVAAALHAGMKPVLVDIAGGSPFPSDWTLEGSASGKPVALVNVNFLGLPPPVPAWDSLDASRPSAYHIYDCCQGWPVGAVCPDWAYATVVSFGRGKPITLGSGGGVFFNRTLHAPVVLTPERVGRSRSALSYRLRSVLYNVVLDPRIFYWVDKVPGLHIGETRYQALESVEAMCDQAKMYLAANITAYERQAKPWTVGRVREHIGSGPYGSFRHLTAFQECNADVRLLRLPLLAESLEQRDFAVTELRRAGFAATAMYRAPLWAFEGLEFLRPFAQRCPNAADFADRLMTLPLHVGVSEQMLEDLVTRLTVL
jgi:dTDP-4-amino-4,6-dideoxygalactose transaminase